MPPCISKPKLHTYMIYLFIEIRENRATGPGENEIGARVLTIASYILIAITFPISVFLCIKVSIRIHAIIN